MKHTSLPKPLLVRKTTRNQFVRRACTSLMWVLLWVGVGSFVDQATGACLSCKVSHATVATVNSTNTAGHLIVEGLEKRTIATLQSMGVSLAKPRITSPEHDQIFVGADVTLTVESAIENLQCAHGRYQLVWLRARVEPDNPGSLHWTIWPEGPSHISCAEPTVQVHCSVTRTPSTSSTCDMYRSYSKDRGPAVGCLVGRMQTI